MNNLTRLIRYDNDFLQYSKALLDDFKAHKPYTIVTNGLTGGVLDAFLCESVLIKSEVTSSPVLILVPSEQKGERTVSALCKAGINARLFKSRDFVFHNITASHDLERERLSVLSEILSGGIDAVVATPTSAIRFTIPKNVLADSSFTLKAGDEAQPEVLCKKLVALGFRAVDSVESTGQFSRRGDILDIWQMDECDPVRIEFFGDEVDRISYFEPLTQRSLDVCESVKLIPATETVITEKAKSRILSAIDKLIDKCENSETVKKLNEEKNALKEGLGTDFRDKYLGLIYEENYCLLDYFSDMGRSFVFVTDTVDVNEELKKGCEQISSQTASMKERSLVSESFAKYTRDREYYDRFLESNVTVHLNAFSGGLGNIKNSLLFGFRFRKTVAYGKNPTMLLEDIKNYRKTYYKIILVSENKQGADSLIEALAKEDIHAFPIYDKEDYSFDALSGGQIAVDVGMIEGFELISPKICVLSMAEDEGRAVIANRRRQRLMRKMGGASQKLMSYADLSVGDYVVHANYGIGIFEGIETVRVDGVKRDYITIRYSGTDKLFLPCERLEYIAKYIGERDKDGKVKLSTMGGSDWTRAKSRAKAAAQNIAKELIALYAQRQRMPGFAFSDDSEMEKEFFESFPYELTEAQSIAMEEIKADMKKSVPMNRLLCGDVGFGKTELALRAAFKAVMSGKQVALLVPTTILAMQHYETAVSRMRNYPINIEMLSRHKTPKEQANIFRRLKRGDIDIIIGTHKLISKDVEFRDLGLLIIDEEQRFGVAQKEKIKKSALNIDVLTLSATPIPRTLNMAMNKISDMSILDEAPGDRLPVQTYVMEYDEEIIYDAINKELLRQGQVLYLYNKIEDIAFTAAKIQHAIPHARVVYAHGQMDKEEIEDIWRYLVLGEIDVLVSTSIIETGIDLPNANTLIIENADKMGLSQLHQLRGRVGRSQRQAYAYFTFRAGKAISEVAQKRLNAIRDYAEFGAGFKIALRDMEIRGVGNLLGSEQHGNINNVGYDLYVKLLNEAVLEESGVQAEPPFESRVKIQLDANIPASYISSEAQRMEMYKKISLITTPDDYDDVLDEFVDRFGDIPRETQNLIRISLIRSLSSEAKIRLVDFSGSNVVFYQDRPMLDIWSELFSKYKDLTFRSQPSANVTLRIRSGEDAVGKAVNVLKDYYNTSQTEKGE